MPYRDWPFWSLKPNICVGIFKFHKHVRKPSSTVLSSCFSLCSSGRLPYQAGSCTYSSQILLCTHFLSRKKEDQDYHHLSYEWNTGQAHFQFTAVKLAASTSYLFPGEKKINAFSSAKSFLGQLRSGNSSYHIPQPGTHTHRLNTTTKLKN